VPPRSGRRRRSRHAQRAVARARAGSMPSGIYMRVATPPTTA
jgi:hypothetical protein